MQINIKRKIYIALFIILGILLGLLLHAAVELWYLDRLFVDFPKYSLGYTWAQWYGIHRIFAIATLVLGVIFGFFQGRFWWRIVYVEGRLDPFFDRLKRIVYGKNFRR